MPQDRIAPPTLTLPTGGGVLRGLDVVARASPFRGSAGVAMPIHLPNGRAGAPHLTLVYDSGAGNGAYGAGASIALPSIARSTAAGVPTYTDADQLISSEIGYLVEQGEWQDGRWIPAERTYRDTAGETWMIRRYLPQQEAGFALIERWTPVDQRTPHWRVVGADAVESLYGLSSDSRIADPDDPARILEWLIDSSSDAKGNQVRYAYRREDDAGTTPRQGSTANRYIARIRYGNWTDDDFAFDIRFDYGDYDLDDPGVPGAIAATPVRAWPVRPDAFSNHRPGFDLRTNRLCHGVVTFTVFPADLGNVPVLAAATRFAYTPSPYRSCLRTATQIGYRRRDDGGYAVETLPPAVFDFTDFVPPPAPEFRRLAVDRQADLPGYLAPGAYQPIDLDGEGIAGFLQSGGDGTRYYAPLGDGRYAAARVLATFPDIATLADPRVTLTDLDGDGRIELLVTSDTRSGFFRRRDDGGWSGFQPIARIPTIEESGAAEYVDLTGDGLADLMTVRRTAIHYYPSRGERGFGPPGAADRHPDFPAATNNDPVEYVAFADIFGDGLSHRVRVTDGEVAVWPNLGHGRFGAKRILAGAPRFDGAVQASRCHFADIDGTGAADLVIAASDRVFVYRNQSGNGFAAPFAVPLPFRFGDADQVSFADIMGNGTTAIVATRVAPQVEHWFCDLSAPADRTTTKPFLLAATRNGFGASCTIAYRSSVAFYLDDKRAGRGWPTRLPFPVQLVETLTTADAVTGATTLQRFGYHDGFYDGLARVFRGFGYVETWSEQRYAPFTATAGWPTARVNADLQVAPVQSRDWYFTGAYFQSAALARQNAADFWQGDRDAGECPATAFDPMLIAAGGAALRQAYAALAGRPIRSELYGQDGTAPYCVTTASYDVRLLQSSAPHDRVALYVREREAIRYTYERDATDPRIDHDVLLVTSFPPPGQPGAFYERHASLCYPRRTGAPPPILREQTLVQCGVRENRSTFVTAPFRSIGIPYEQRTLDIGGFSPPAGPLYGFAEIERQVAAALQAEILYGTGFTPGQLQSRAMEHTRRYYWDEAQSTALPLGQITARALLHHLEDAQFPQQWVADIFGTRLIPGDLGDLAGLVEDGGYWWNPGLVRSYHPAALFCLPSGTHSSGLFARSEIAYDDYALLPVSVAQYVDAATPLTVTARNDYQAVQPCQITDANGIVSQALYTPLALVLATSIFKPAAGATPRVGDGDLAAYVATSGSFAQIIADPAAYLQHAATVHAYDPSAHPAASLTLTATRFVSDGIADPPIAIAMTYADGFGRPVERQCACEPDAEGQPQWRASDRTVHDAQGQPAQTYSAYYLPAPGYLPQQALADADRVAPPRIAARDPLGRIVRVATSKGFVTRTVHAAWQTSQYDEDDTILDAPFYRDFMAGYPALPTTAAQDEKAALDKAAAFFDTPGIDLLDPAGHPIRRIAAAIGAVPPDYFAAIVNGDVTSPQLCTALIAAGYFETTSHGMRVTTAFQPYRPGFALNLPAPYDRFAAQASALLTDTCLTTLLVVDSAGRAVQASDPRLFLADIQSGATACSMRYAYPMGSPTAALTDSADAGPRWQLSSALGQTVLRFDAIGRREQLNHDGLGRPLATIVTEPDASTRTTEILTYGEAQAGAAAGNLMGQVYRIEDQAGVLDYPAYTILGQPSQSIRQFVADYTRPPDWARPVTLDPLRLASDFTYDARRGVLTETLPDTSIVIRSYWVSARLATIEVTLPGGARRPLIAAIAYAADDARTRIAYGNGAIQTLGYEATTGRLLTLGATRPVTASRDPVVQAVDYSYDPVGNVSIVRDRTAQLLFAGGTEPVAIGDYGYDALYRLVSANGLQHPGIDADTHVTGFLQSLYAELSPAGGPPVALEPYTETYRYDFSGNLMATAHAATSASFDRLCPVLAESNRLADTPYDANGNVLSTDLTAATPLVWDARNHLVQVGPAAGGGDRFDTDHDARDVFGDRVRHVVEQAAGIGAPADTVDQDLIVGSYILRRSTADGSSTSTSVLRIADGTTCFAVTDTLSGGAPELRYQFDDRLGSTSVELGQDAGILSYEAFYPYGGTAIVAGSDQAAVARKRYRYSGQPCDDGTGFYTYPARTYLPWQGRWLSADPSGAADGLNLYRFVGGNPTTLIDLDGRGRDDPQSAKPTPFERAVTSFVRSAFNGIMMAPIYAFSYAPQNLLRRLNGTQEDRADDRRNALARREEMRVLYYNLALAYGVDPAAYISPALLGYVRPVQPWAMTWIPGVGYPLHNQLRQRIADPAMLSGMAGGMFGGFLVVGTTLGVARQLIRPGRVGIAGTIVTFAIGFTLQAIGQGEESNRVYRAYTADQARLWFWQRDYVPRIAGLERRLAHDAFVERRMTDMWNERSAGVLGAIFTAAVLYRLFGPATTRYGRRTAGDWVRRRGDARSDRSGSGSPGTALMIRPSNLPLSTMLIVRRQNQRALIRYQQAQRALIRYQDSVRALTIVRQQNRALAVIQPQPTAVTRYVARPTALQIVPRQANALIPYVPQPNALQIVRAATRPGGAPFARVGVAIGVLTTGFLLKHYTTQKPPSDK